MTKWTTTNTQFLIKNEDSGTFYLQKWIGGKTVRKSLKTKSVTVAKIRLQEEITRLSAATAVNRSTGSSATIAECLDIVKARIPVDPNLREASATYRLATITFLEKTFPELKKMKPRDLTALACETWFKSIKNAFSGALVNNSLGSLRMVIKEAIRSGLMTSDPTTEIKKARVAPKKLDLPSPDDFKRLIAAIRKPKGEKKHSWKSDAAADLVEFLAYSGCRIAGVNGLKWSDVDTKRKQIHVTEKGGKSRYIPIIKALEELLERLPVKNEYVLRVKEAEKSMTRACDELGIARITHHDCRHLFATTCIESGVDIPTVSSWLGHSDGGVLALRTYGHLRESHSSAAASKVNF
jgi:integrase